MVYYRRKKVSKSRGWMRRNIGRAGSALKKRYVSKGKLSLAKVASDAKYALSIAKTASGLLNTEKKRTELNFYNYSLAQVSHNSTGHTLFEITPTPSQGTGNGGRVGSSISLRSFHLRLNMWQQSDTVSPINMRFYIVQTRNGESLDISKFLQYNKYLYAQNSVAIYDLQSQRDPDYFNDIKVIRSKAVRMKTDAFDNCREIKSFSLSCNFGRNGKHIRFNDNGNTPSNTRLWFVGVADNGNCSQANASTLAGVINTGANTGIIFNIDMCHYFIDN